MKKLRVLTAVLAAAGWLTGCTVIRELPVEARKGQPEGADFDLCRTLIEAFLKNDAKTFLATVPEEVRQTFNEKVFANSRKSVCDAMGEPISYQYVTALELTKNLTPYIWKIRFKRVNRKDEEFTSELLFRIVVGKIDGKPVMMGFQFL